jgi:hypothetical protein
MDASVVVALAMSFVALLLSLAMLGLALWDRVRSKKKTAYAYELYIAQQSQKIESYKTDIEEARSGQVPAPPSTGEGSIAQFTQALSEAIYQPPSLSHASDQSPPR